MLVNFLNSGQNMFKVNIQETTTMSIGIIAFLILTLSIFNTFDTFI